MTKEHLKPFRVHEVAHEACVQLQDAGKPSGDLLGLVTSDGHSTSWRSSLFELSCESNADIMDSRYMEHMCETGTFH